MTSESMFRAKMESCGLRRPRGENVADFALYLYNIPMKVENQVGTCKNLDFRTKKFYCVFATLCIW